MSTLPDEQAADWLAKLQSDDVTAEEHADLERWLGADPANAVAFARTEFAWERAKRLQALPMSTHSSPQALPLWRREGMKAWLAAAALAALTASGALWYYVTQWNAYYTHLGERRTVALTDGSQVDLNTS